MPCRRCARSRRWVVLIVTASYGRCSYSYRLFEELLRFLRERHGLLQKAHDASLDLLLLTFPHTKQNASREAN